MFDAYSIPMNAKECRCCGQLLRADSFHGFGTEKERALCKSCYTEDRKRYAPIYQLKQYRKIYKK